MLRKYSVVFHFLIKTKYLLLALQSRQTILKGIKSAIYFFLKLFKHCYQLIIDIVGQFTLSKWKRDIFMMFQSLIHVKADLFNRLNFKWLTFIHFILLLKILEFVLIVEFLHFSFVHFHSFSFSTTFLALNLFYSTVSSWRHRDSWTTPFFQIILKVFLAVNIFRLLKLNFRNMYWKVLH